MNYLLRTYFVWFSVLSSLSLFSPDALAQNKVITRNFNWQIKSMPHFDIYYYDADGRRLLPSVERDLADAYRRVTKVLPNAPKESVPFFLYNTHNDFEQTNIADIGEGTGGVTELFKNRFAVGHRGSQRELAYIINHEYAHEVEFEYLFSGFWRSVRILKSVFYPNWLLEGLAEYSTGDTDRTVREMYVRDAAISGNLLPVEQLYNFNHVLPHQVTLAYKESEALIRFIAEEYGEDTLPKLLLSFQDHFDINAVLQDVLSTDLFTLGRKFREYMEDKYAVLSAGLSEPSDYGKLLTRSGAYPRFFESAVFSPDGRQIAYLSDETGHKDLYVMDLASRKSTRVWNLDKSIRVENIHGEGNGLAFSPDGAFLAFAGEREQKDRLYLYRRDKGTLQEINTRTETVASPAFSPDGKTIYFSGIREGFRNLYSFDIASRKLTPLTTGAMDKIGATPSPDGNFLYFSEEREDGQGAITYRVCRMDLRTKESVFLTALPGNERFPCPSPDGRKLYFISDQGGVDDIHVLDLERNRIDRLTRVAGGNFQPRVSPDGEHLLFASFRKGEQHLYYADLAALAPVDVANAGVTLSSAPAVSPPGELSREPARSYRFNVSTDLFFPALFYSSIDGLYLATYWQASDFLGNHQVQSQVSYANAADYLDYSISYGLLPFRTQFYFNFSGQQYYWDVQQTIRRKEFRESMTAVYPLNRFQRLEFMLGTIDRQEQLKDIPGQSWKKRENITGFAFVHDTAQGPYLEATSGLRVSLSGQFSEKVLDGDYRYQSFLGHLQRFFPLGRENVLVSRTLLGGSFGEDAGFFRLGGDDRVRGVPQDLSFAGHKLFVQSVEWRFPVVKNINYHMWYIFPDFFFKTFYGVFFVDSGVTWDGEDNELGWISPGAWKASYGLGLRFHTFILQSYPLLLNLQLAQQIPGSVPTLYFSAGSGF